jgi:hypothetical protein
MISYYEINTNRRILATNITAVSEFSGISYHKIRNWLNGIDLYKDDNVIIFQQDVVKGKQRLQKVGKIDLRSIVSGNGGPDHPVIQEEIQTVKRKTKQPDKRDMSGFDNFFSEVK